jgi:hypothetical protein
MKQKEDQQHQQQNQDSMHGTMETSRRAKGAEQMDESLDRPASGKEGRGDSSRYANTSDNEDYHKK